MKKLFLLAALLFGAQSAHAAYARVTGNIDQAPVKYNTSTGYLTLDVDFSGLGGLSVTASMVSNTAVAQGAAGSAAWPSADTKTAGILAGATSTAAPFYVTTAGGAIATEGSVSAISSNLLTFLGIYQGTTSGANATYVNANGFNFLSATVVTGLSPSTETVTSLTWAASTTAGPVFVDINCSGMTGLDYMITNASTAVPGFVANKDVWGYQPCGQISQIPLEINAGNTPHIHMAGNTLSFTSGTVGLRTYKRP